MSNFTKFYWGLWAILAVVTLGIFVAGDITWFSISVVGVISCTLVFTGMICVTISIVGPHADEYQHHDAEPLPEKKVRKAVTPARVAAPAVAMQRGQAHYTR